MTGVIAAAGITAAAGLASGAMSAMGSKGGSTAGMPQQQTQIPEWQNNGYMQQWSDAKDIAYNMPGPYSGQRVADLTPEQRALIGQMYGRVGSTDPAFDTSMGWTNMLAGYNPQMVQAQMLANTNLSPYMNPYTQSVLDPSLKALEQQRLQAQNQNAAAASQAKAFGGSRHGITEAQTNTGATAEAGKLAANLRSQNFLQAQSAAAGDISNRLRADQSNQQYDLEGARFRANMANQYANLASGKQNAWLTGVNAATAGQDVLYGNQQAQLDAAQKAYEEQRWDPYQRWQIRQGALQAPTGQSTYTQGPQTSGNPWLTGLGTAATTAGLLGQTGAFKKGGWLGDIFGSGSGSRKGLYSDNPNVD